MKEAKEMQGTLGLTDSGGKVWMDPGSTVKAELHHEKGSGLWAPGRHTPIPISNSTLIPEPQQPIWPLCFCHHCLCHFVTLEMHFIKFN